MINLAREQARLAEHVEVATADNHDLTSGD